MAGETTQGILLKVNDYRESSCILYFLTPNHGLVHGVAKGVKRKKTCVPSIERGFLVELVLYCRPHRDLHTIGTIGVLNYYRSTRVDLFKTIIRDIAFEVVLTSMSQDSSHPEIFSFLKNFCDTLETMHTDNCFPVMIWRFFYGYLQIMGLAPNIDTCISCDNDLIANNGGFFVMNRGGILCNRCASISPSHNGFIPEVVLQTLKHNIDNAMPDTIQHLPTSENRRIIGLFARYCQYHLHHESNYKSLEFLDSLMPDTILSVMHG